MHFKTISRAFGAENWYFQIFDDKIGLFFKFISPLLEQVTPQMKPCNGYMSDHNMK